MALLRRPSGLPAIPAALAEPRGPALSEGEQELPSASSPSPQFQFQTALLGRGIHQRKCQALRQNKKASCVQACGLLAA